MDKLTFEDFKDKIGTPHYTDEYKQSFKRLHGVDLDQLNEETLRREYDTYCNDLAEGWVEVNKDESL